MGVLQQCVWMEYGYGYYTVVSSPSIQSDYYTTRYVLDVLTQVHLDQINNVEGAISKDVDMTLYIVLIVQ